MTMQNTHKFALVLSKTAFLALLLGGCGGDDANTDTQSETETGDGDGDPTTGDGDGDPTTGDGDGDPTTGDGDGDPTGDGDGDATGDGDGDATGDGDGDGDATGDGDGDATGDGDGDATGDGDGDTTGDGDGDTTGDGDGDDEAFPEVDDACDADVDTYACVPALDGAAGTPLRCAFLDDTWDTTVTFNIDCFDVCGGGVSAVNACGGVGTPAVCLCAPNVAVPCDGAELGCTGTNEVSLCHEGSVVVGECNNCSETVSGYYNCD
jgi:hypothetical protein